MEGRRTEERDGGGAPTGPGVGRAKYLRVDGPGAPVVTMTRGELAELVTQGIIDGLAQRGLMAPRLFDRAELASALCCSPGYVDKLRRRGMPHLYLGDSPRFEVEACLEWIRQGGASEAG